MLLLTMSISWMDKVFKFKMIQESKNCTLMLEELRIFIFSADENQDAYFANSTTKVMIVWESGVK